MLIFIWLAGDLYKLSYYMANASPIALQACAAFQIFMDLCILAQFVIYRKNTPSQLKENNLYQAMSVPQVDTTQATQ